jgi:hypothetical protein
VMAYFKRDTGLNDILDCLDVIAIQKRIEISLYMVLGLC